MTLRIKRNRTIPPNSASAKEHASVRECFNQTKTELVLQFQLQGTQHFANLNNAGVHIWKNLKFNLQPGFSFEKFYGQKC